MADLSSKYVRQLVTPEGVTLNIRRAGAGARAGAFAIDVAIMLVVLIAATIILFGVAVYGPSVSAGYIIWLLGFFLLRNFYFAFFESGPRGATPGKRMMKIRVAARDGGRLTGGAVLARNLMRELELFLPPIFLIQTISSGSDAVWTGIMAFGWTAVLMLFPLFNKDRLRIGDLIAGTWVVENERPVILPDLAAEPVSAQNMASTGEFDFTPEQLSIYGQAEIQRLADVLQRDDADQLATVSGVIRRKINYTRTISHIGEDRAFLNAYYAAARHHLERKLLLGKRKRDKFDRLN